MAEPLAGRTIAVTRPLEQSQPLATRLEKLGARVEVVPLVRIERLAKVDDVAGYDWVILTSANAAAALEGVDLRGPRIAAVGPATAAAAESLGAEVAFVPDTYAAADVGAGLGPLDGARVLLPQAEDVSRDLADELRARGAHVDVVVAYRTVSTEPTPGLDALRVADAVVLASGSAARSLAAQGGAGDALVVCIGPQTEAVARELGLRVGLVAAEATAEGIIQALVSHFGESS